MKTKTTTIRRLLAFFVSVITLVSVFATTGISASAAGLKPSAKGIKASYSKSVYNDEKCVIIVDLTSASFCEQVTVTLGNQSKTIKPTTKTKPVRQTAKVSFAAYTFNPGKYSLSVTAKNSSGKTTKKIGTITVKDTYSVSQKVLTIKGVKMNEFKVGGKYTNSRYVTINGKKRDLAAWECYGFCRYLQTKLTSLNSGTATNKFSKLSGSKNVNPSNAKLKTLIQKAGVGAHIRTSSGHSMMVIGITNSGMTIADANADYKNTIRVKSYTWSSFKKAWGKIAFIEVYTG